MRHLKYIPNPPFLVFSNTPYNAGPRTPLTCGYKESQKTARLTSCISAEAGFNLGARKLPAALAGCWCTDGRGRKGSEQLLTVWEENKGSQGFQKEVQPQNYGKGKGDRDRGQTKGDNNFCGICGNREVSEC